MLNIQSLKYKYNDKLIFNIDNWKVNQGEHWLLVGQSGSGKTTLLHILGGLLKSQNGQITIKDQNISQLSQTQIDKFRARNIGMIFQKPHLIQTLTVLKNLLLTQYLAGLKQDKKHCEHILNELNILDKKNSYPKKLSEGEAQRVSVARAIINQPSLILADEPTASLDDYNAEKVISLLKEQAQKTKASLIIATHDSRVKAHFDKVFEL